MMTIIKIMIRKLICGLILVSDSHPTVKDKIQYLITIITTFSGFIYIAEGLDLWFKTNHRFFFFVVLSVLINLGVGAWFHLRNNTFNWEMMLKRNSLMIVTLCLSYLTLEMLRLTAGENVATEVFRVVIQVSTLLYPGSKILKNLYILSNKQFPPKFIMERLYKFEQSGNLDDLYKEGKEEINQQDVNEIEVDLINEGKP